MTNRKLSELGIHPVLGYLSGILVFMLVSEYAFYKTGFAAYGMVLMALSFLMKAAEINRTEFLSIVFNRPQYRKIRIVENVLISLPFFISLVYHHAFSAAILLMAGSGMLAGFSFKNNFSYSLPTPFYKNPFEFTVGFRNTFYLFPAAYALTIIALSVDNRNLGIFAMLFVFLVAFSYYVKPEHAYFVWIYAVGPSRFILEKIRTATIYAAFMVLPVFISLVVYYPQDVSLVGLFAAIGFVFLWTIILAKYAAYPREMNLPESIILAACVFFPPLLLAVMPFFYVKSVKKLNALLK